MENLSQPILETYPQRPPWRNVMLLLGFILLGMSAGNLLGIAVVVFLSMFSPSTLSVEQFAELMQTPDKFPNAWLYIMIIQAISHLFTFLIPSLAYWQWSEKHHVVRFLHKSLPSVSLLILTLLLVVVFMPFNTWIIDWNSHLQFPNGLSQLETWMRTKEDELGNLTRFLTRFDSLPRLVVALVVIAIIPAVGEEVLFRGIIQRKIYNKTGEMHAAIWLSAALFSAIHLQFYGFVPRLLLGAMFGYLYAWSRNLWTAIFAHFINNGFTVLMLFLSYRGIVDVDLENTKSSVPLAGAALSLLITMGLLLYLKSMAERAALTQNGA